jgi:P4 family phage/plasmid primase-like protien
MYDTAPHQELLTWAALRDRLSVHQRRTAKDGPLFSPVSYRDGATRGKAGVEQVFLAVADVDAKDVEGGVSAAQFLERFPPDLEVLISSTHSSTPEHPKFRAVTPLATPCAAHDWPEAWTRIQAHVWGGLSDVHTRDQSRVFYLPSCPPDAEPFVVHRPGRALDWRALPHGSEAARGAREQGGGSWDGDGPHVLDLQLIRDGVPEGQRDARINAYAWHLHAQGWDEDAAVQALIEAADRCRPPFDHDEALKKWHRVCVLQGPPLPPLDISQVDWAEEVPDPAGQDAVPTKTYHRTDLGNAERLVAAHGQDMRFCRELGAWLIWTGTHWEHDGTGRANRLAKATAKAIWREIDRAETVEEKKAIAGHAARSESSRSISAMLQLAETEPGVPIRQSKLDQDAWALSVQNGTLDLRTGELREHRRDDYITHLVPITFDPLAACPRFEQFLDEIMKGRRGLIEYLQRIIGYCLTGSVRERALLIFWGHGANGKSTLLELIADLLGEYAAKTPISTLMVKQGDAIPNDVARLRGKRFVYASEGEEGKRLAEAKIKELTGNERMVARFMHAEFFEFEPQFKIVVGTNHKPEINGTDDAIWDRVKLIPFEARFEGQAADPHLGDKLRAELPGIFAWAVRGCLEWRRSGLKAPGEVTRAVEGYRIEMDSVAQFLAECCVVDRGAQVPMGVLYMAYEAWCRDTGARAIGPKHFARRLGERGAERAKGTGGVRLWLGIGLDHRGGGVAEVAEVAQDPGFPPIDTASEHYLKNAPLRPLRPLAPRGDRGAGGQPLPLVTEPHDAPPPGQLDQPNPDPAPPAAPGERQTRDAVDAAELAAEREKQVLEVIRQCTEGLGKPSKITVSEIAAELDWDVAEVERTAQRLAARGAIARRGDSFEMRY